MSETDQRGENASAEMSEARPFQLERAVPQMTEPRDLDIFLSPHQSNSEAPQDSTIPASTFSYLNPVNLDLAPEAVTDPAEMSFPLTSDATLWDPSPLNLSSYPTFDVSIHVSLQLLLSQVQALTTRVEALEASNQQTSTAVNDFTKWSKKMEKHSQDVNGTVLELFEKVQTPGFLRSVLNEPTTPSSSSWWGT